ncbi:Type 1 glutamine amidotransferase-like domain-containing protein [Jeotgalibacillus proteolyticus]|uniref:Type 1 glutamine amidotransferase-like domain-containing protein n=1 Tax=Jeotgalibacillus proteolyticus TaxID=2082395 RepID=UPI003CEF8E54
MLNQDLKTSDVKLLLTSAGVNNSSIHHALVDMLDKPIEDCTALCIPTAMYGHPWVGPGVKAWEFITGNAENPMVDLGWKSVGILELTALPSIGNDRWVPLVKETDVLLVSGGDALFLNHWMRESGLTDLLPSLNAVYVGMSAGSMVMAPKIGEEFIGWRPPAGGDAALGLVDFAIFPHLGHEMLPDNTLENAEKWAKGISVPGYAIDDQTAIKVINGSVEVISEGQWTRFNS